MNSRDKKTADLVIRSDENMAPKNVDIFIEIPAFAEFFRCHVLLSTVSSFIFVKSKNKETHCV